MAKVSSSVALLWILPIGVFAARLIQNVKEEYAHNASSRIPHMEKGVKWECDGINVTLDDYIGKGNWGAVWTSADRRYAVKVEIQKRPNDKYEFLKDLKHECGVMRDLEKVHGITVPRCHGICEKEGSQIIIMDLLQNVSNMRTVAQNYASYDMYKVAQQLYFGVTAMHSAGIINVGQSDTNILVGSDSKVYFIDMGMAEREREALQMYSDAVYAKKYGVLKKFSAFGKDAGIPFQLGLVYSNTASSVLHSIPTRSPEAMQGLADAFCAYPFSNLVATLYTEVLSGQHDKRFFEALTGLDFMGDKAREPQFASKGAGHLVKVDNFPFQVTNHYNRAEIYQISPGAELYGLLCQGDYSVVVKDFEMPRSKNQMCKGWYYFKEDAPYIAKNVKAVFQRAGHPDFKCK